MFKEDYKAAFSKVNASGDTYRRVMNMTSKGKPKKGGHRVAVLIAAVIALMAMAVTVSASEDVRNWFVRFFDESSETTLSTQQVEFIEENVQNIGQKQTQDGYTLELKSAITDGTIAYITIGVAAPDDVILSRTIIEGYDPKAPTLTAGNWGNDFLMDAENKFRLGGMSMSTLEDHDGLDNTQDLLICVEPGFEQGEVYPFHSGMVWNLHFEDLIAEYTDAVYMKEIQEKYSSESDISDVVDEEKLWPEVKLAEGVWDFTITFGDSDFREVELIAEPVSALAFVGTTGDSEDANMYETVTISSFVLRTLSASISSENDRAFSFTGFDYMTNTDHTVSVVMKDGSRVDLTGGSNRGTQYMTADAPIVLEEVDYIEFSDGTIIPMPELETE